jgi:hypothetical protein
VNFQLRRLARGLVGVMSVGVATAVLAAPAPAFADAADEAACLGVVSSSMAGEPGARADTAHLILAISPEVTGEPPGAFYKIFAQRHPGGEFSC